jgi:hypothetical protein
MKIVFLKPKFPAATGGDRYEWNEAETEFMAPENGMYIICITASAKNGTQNGTGDDDDLRMILDDYEFGKDEVHEGITSWHGFGVAAAWDGASLRGGQKTVYFFVEFKKGQHILRFMADGKPELNEIKIYQLKESEGVIEDAIFEFNETAPGIKIEKNGIPWKAFVFQSQFNTDPFRVYLAEIIATCHSGKQKRGTDGDNLKFFVNGKILSNPKLPISDKYKNFFFSGDQMQGKTQSLVIPGDQFLFSLSGDFSIEIWYDETPVLETVRFEIPSGTKYDGGLLKIWQSNIAELMELPGGIQKKIITLNGIVNESLNRTMVYAEKNGFVSIDENGNKHHDIHNNEADAFRHFIWSALLYREFGENHANLITTNHEIFWRNASNKKDFSTEAIMDMRNNMMGLEYAKNNPDKTPEELFSLALKKKAVVIKPDDVSQAIRDKVTGQFNKLTDEN